MKRGLIKKTSVASQENQRVKATTQRENISTFKFVQLFKVNCLLALQTAAGRSLDKTVLFIVLTSLRPGWKLSYPLPPTPCCMGTSGDTVSIAVFMIGYLQVN